jgi:quinol monooxygenase YgiN
MAEAKDEVFVVVKLIVKKGMEQEMVEGAAKPQELTRAEEGCLFYDLVVDKADPQKYYLVEKWTSQDALDKHGNQPHVQDIRAVFAQCCESVSLSACKFVQ